VNRGLAKRVAVTCWLVLSAAGYGQTGKTPMVAGDEKALWLIRTSSGGESFDIVCRPAGGKWRWAAKQRVGAPVAAAVVDGSLNVAFASGQCYVFGLEAGTEAPGPALPAAPLGLFAAGELELESPAGLAALLPAADLPTTVSATSASTATSPSTAAPGGAAVEVVVNTPSQWQHLTTIRDLPADAIDRLRAVALDGALYLLVPGGDGRANRLAMWHQGQWRDVPLEQTLSDGNVIGMQAVGGRLVIVVAGPSHESGKVSLQVASWNIKSGEFTYQPVTADGKAAVWSSGAVPKAAVLADKLALLWQEGATAKLATCNPATGVLDPAEEITIFRQPPVDDRGRGIFLGMLWGVVTLILVLMVTFRPAGAARPFTLPQHLAAAPLGRRLLAAVVDLLPFQLAAVAYMRTSLSMTSKELWDLLIEATFNKGPVPAQIAYAWAGAILLYLVYCIVLEMRVGATVGKIALRMRVVADNGEKAEWRGILLRNLVKVVELSFPVLLITTVLDHYRRRLGDMLGRTTVVNAEYAEPLPPGVDGGRRGGGQDGGASPPLQD